MKRKISPFHFLLKSRKEGEKICSRLQLLLLLSLCQNIWHSLAPTKLFFPEPSLNIRKKGVKIGKHFSFSLFLLNASSFFILWPLLQLIFVFKKPWLVPPPFRTRTKETFLPFYLLWIISVSVLRRCKLSTQLNFFLFPHNEIFFCPHSWEKATHFLGSFITFRRRRWRRLWIGYDFLFILYRFFCALPDKFQFPSPSTFHPCSCIDDGFLKFVPVSPEASKADNFFHFYFPASFLHSLRSLFGRQTFFSLSSLYSLPLSGFEMNKKWLADSIFDNLAATLSSPIHCIGFKRSQKKGVKSGVCEIVCRPEKMTRIVGRDCRCCPLYPLHQCHFGNVNGISAFSHRKR